MSTQTEARRLADRLDLYATGDDQQQDTEQAAAELRRLEAANAELLEALTIAEAALADIGDADREPDDDVAWCESRAAQAIPVARAAIAKHGGAQ